MIFSDGKVTPEWRVKEAWQDGMDIVAITDHIENRPYVTRIPKYLDGVEVKVENERNISVDLNALFTTDNNAVPAEDPLQALRNAKAQGHLSSLIIPARVERVLILLSLR